jgi:hypothetical protein
MQKQLLVLQCRAFIVCTHRLYTSVVLTVIQSRNVWYKCDASGSIHLAIVLLAADQRSIQHDSLIAKLLSSVCVEQRAT